MPEGVECLIVANSLQQWFKELDKENKYNVPLYLEEILDSTLVRYSPIQFSEFNNIFKFVNYPKITTFGKTIFIPSISDYCIAIQLGMTGSFANIKNKFSRLCFSSPCKYEDAYLFYEDIRKFGHLFLFSKHNLPRNISNLIKNSIDWRNKKAPELFAKKVVRRKKWINKDIKTLLLNQQVIAGIGNIYACEALFLAGIHPRTITKDLSAKSLSNIIFQAQIIMQKSYQVGGMSIRTFKNFEKKGFGKKYLNVYDRYSLMCKRCNGAFIQKINQNDRTTYYCPKCQKATHAP